MNLKSSMSLVSLFALTAAIVGCGSDSCSSTNVCDCESSSSSAANSSSSLQSSSSVVESSSSIVSETFTDTRDGQIYKIMVIGDQTWMAENLNFVADNSYCYGDDSDNCTTYGRLYTWAVAIDVCPEGWYLPTSDEWGELATTVGGLSIAGTQLKSTAGWDNSGNGSDNFGFSALPAGFRFSSGAFYDVGNRAYFWSATEDLSNSAFSYSLGAEDADMDSYKSDRVSAFSVRCLKN